MSEATVPADIAQTGMLFQGSEGMIVAAVEWLRLGVETMGAVIIAIAVIRTALNFFLMREMEMEKPAISTTK